MARLIGPDEASREVKAIVGKTFRSKDGSRAQLWSDDAATIPADVLWPDGSAIPVEQPANNGGRGLAPTVTIDTSSMLPLIQYPPGDVDVVYATVDGGPAWPVYARTDDRLDTLATRVGTVEGVAVGAVQRGELVVNLRNYTTGTADDTTAIQSALTAAVTAGVPLYAPPGTYRAAGVVLSSYATIIGAGSELTIFKLPDGGSGAVFVGADFASLTGGGGEGGPSGVTLSGLTIDGNKAADLAGTWGIQKYGYRWQLHDVVVRNCVVGGIYSEWGADPGAGADGGFMEDLLSNIRVHSCAGYGIQWRGPHDTRIEQALIYANGGIGLSIEGSTTYHAGGILLDGVHVYGNQSHGIQVISTNNQGASINAATFISESNAGTGLILAANGSVVSSGNFYSNGAGGIAIQNSAAAYNISAFCSNNTGAQLALTADGGDGIMVVGAFTGAAGQSALSGSPHPSTQMELVSTGSGTLINRAKFPGEVQAGNGLTIAAGNAFFSDAVTLRLPRTATTNTGNLWYDPATGRLAFRDGVANAPRDLAYHATASNTQLNTATDGVNALGKFAGKRIWNTSANRPVWASGSTATATWVYADGTTAHTPA